MRRLSLLFSFLWRLDFFNPGRVMLIPILLALSFGAQAAAANSDMAPILAQLKTAGFSEKEQLVRDLSEIEHPQVVPVLTALLEGDLQYAKKGEGEVVILRYANDLYSAENVLTGEVAEDVEKRAFKKISVNNSLRQLLRENLAALQLRSPDLNVRLEAARNMMKSDDATNIPLLARALEKEQDASVRGLLAVDLAMLQARHGETTPDRVAAIEQLQGELYVEVRSLLRSFLNTNGQGEFLEPDPAVRQAAQDALASIESLVAFNKGVENVYFGISLGAVLLLAAVGLAITFGVMGVINMAHGEMIMLGAYTTFVIQQWMPNHIEYSLFVAIPAAFLVSGLAGVLIERGVIRFLYGRPLETLLATFGISLCLQQLVRTIFGSLNQSVTTPNWMSGSIEINGALSLTYNRLYIIIFSILVLLALAALLRKTQFGLQMPAVTQNRPMASSMGIRTGWLDAMTFGLGSGIAGIAGVALSQLTNVGPNLGQAYIIDSFMVVVFGGVGNLMGTFVGAMSLGVANKLLEPFAGAVLAKILVLVFIILFIQKYPRGMFALKGRAVEG
ncbi:Branched-chain amino acid ABC-type transport system, permease components [Hahella chejuensis KCTC 2396]|uniref:Branched-chain amino acid ABC-type transport system, permease components n=1 Tax=Hahella chejuensis (strain KCTC 2396) TaxID=349521 RepID=Q2SDQ6_HAHCH|nr:urea ABC transporter permease subunit UrtB [Hahella chejuensis]ABC31218.1 Branched-chain amino acid ABC-type transport system, permease components [Hahella chejuensis KCTC 2396]